MRTPRLAIAVTVSALVLTVGGVASADPGGGGDGPAPDPAAADKLDSGLRLIAGQVAQGRPPSATAPTSVPGVQHDSMVRIRDGEVLVNIYVTGSVPAAAAQLSDLGMQVVATSDREPERAVSGWLPAGALLNAGSLGNVQAVTAVHAMADGSDGTGGTDTGTVLSQGDAAHHGPQARALGTTGAGIKVGVISDSINRVGGGIAASQSSGNLPANVSSLLDDPGGTDEGRAMAEIIYDTAPGVTDMVFSSGTVSNPAKAASINNLVAQGVKVIADDIFALDEPMFQDGIIAQAVDSARAAGVAYFASAGNRARQSWEGTLNGADMDFDPGAGVDTIQDLGSFTNRSPFIALQWAEPWGSATTDLSLLWYVDGVLARTTNTNNLTTGLPLEFDGIQINGTHTLGIGIHRNSASGTPFMKYIVGGTPTFTVAQFPTNSNAINPDAASANGSMAVAASAFGTPATVEAFSSRGPSITRFFDRLGVLLGSPEVRTKPALDAADGVATSVPGFNPFFGTSAATPSAAAVATLVRSANPGLSVDQVRAIMTDPASTIACSPPTAADCGAGFILADAAVTQAQSFLGSPPIVTAQVSPSAPNGAHGWYTTPVSVTFTVSDPETPVVETNGCAPASVTANGTTTLTCTALSAGGTGKATVAIKHDGTGPTKLKAKGLKKTYAHGTKPDKKKIKCKATDNESGIAKCKIKGLTGSRGAHKATVIATNGAGLVTKKTFKYTIL